MAQILIADSNPGTAAYLQAQLKKAGHSLTVVGNALDAWRAIGRTGYDAMITDVSMPGIDGFVLAQRALQENPSTQIIFLTGFAAVSMDTVATPAFAPKPFTSRPFHISDMSRQMRRLLGQGYQIFDNDEEVSPTGDGKVIYADFTTRMQERDAATAQV